MEQVGNLSFFGGGLHGFYLLVNHAWRAAKIWKMPSPAAIGLTFLMTVIAWVPFRAETWDATMIMYQGMVGANGVVLPTHYQDLLPSGLGQWLQDNHVTFGALSVFGGGMQIITLLSMLIIVWFAPNTQQITADFKPTLATDAPDIVRWLRWQPSWRTGIVLGILGGYLGIMAIQGKAGEFIYFQF